MEALVVPTDRVPERGRRWPWVTQKVRGRVESGVWVPWETGSGLFPLALFPLGGEHLELSHML